MGDEVAFREHSIIVAFYHYLVLLSTVTMMR